MMVKRMQILFPLDIYTLLEEKAKSQGKSVAALVREAVQQVYLGEVQAKRLAAAKRLTSMRVPVADWEEIEKQIEEAHFVK